jgi:two-component system OmpR family response regulator
LARIVGRGAFNDNQGGKMQVLVIEDDLQLGRSLSRALVDAGFGVHWIRDGFAGCNAIQGGSYTVVLLDLGLPGLDGIELLKMVRASGSKVPLIILTARDDSDSRVHVLDLGADDYVQKPFEIGELLARIRAVIRRKAGYASSRLGDDSIILDLEKRTLTCGEATETLTAREFALMLAFFERPGAILSREQLEGRVYGWGKGVDSNATDVLIHSVRKKFGPSVIRNVRGLGWTVPLSVPSA